MLSFLFSIRRQFRNSRINKVFGVFKKRFPHHSSIGTKSAFLLTVPSFLVASEFTYYALQKPPSEAILVGLLINQCLVVLLIQKINYKTMSCKLRRFRIWRILHKKHSLFQYNILMNIYCVQWYCTTVGSE